MKYGEETGSNLEAGAFRVAKLLSRDTVADLLFLGLW